MHSKIHFLVYFFFHLVIDSVRFFFPKTRVFWGFYPLFNPYFILTLNWVDFYDKIDLCSKFLYIISKIGESPPKCVSSFPNRDPLLNMKGIQWPETEIMFNSVKSSQLIFGGFLAIWNHCEAVCSNAVNLKYNYRRTDFIKEWQRKSFMLL